MGQTNVNVLIEKKMSGENVIQKQTIILTAIGGTSQGGTAGMTKWDTE
ncbi:MAG: hypothetical protein IJX44_03550 [Bacteroidaceae bacterium]|nr:hypothetical protein [Bacteroidaceae bacterium]